MTVTLPALRRVSSEPATRGRESHTEQLQTICVVLAFVGLGYALRHSGGRERGTTEIALACAAPALLVGRVWRRASMLELVVGLSVAGTAVVLPLVTTLGVSVAGDLDAYTYGVVMYLVVRGYAQGTEQRRMVSVACLCLGVVEFLDVIRVWIGEHDPSFQVVGTFYWHNQFGAFAGAIALLATAMVMRSGRTEDAIAWLVAPLFLTLTWLSHSRAAILAFLLAGVTLPVVALVRRQWWAILRLACALALAVVVHVLLIAAVSGRGADQGFSPGKDTLSSTSGFRMTAGEEAMKVFARAPLTSHGYGSLAITGWQHAPRGTTISPFAHSAEAQALTDGGLLLGLPVLLAVALLCANAVRNCTKAVRRDDGPSWLVIGSGLAALTMLLHASVDFDSQYPVLVALLAILAALAAPTPIAGPTKQLGLRRLVCALTVVATVLGGFLVAAYWQTGQRVDTATSLLRSDSAQSIATARSAMSEHHFRDSRPAEFIVHAADLGYPADDATLREALKESHAYAAIHQPFAAVWARVNARVRAASPPTSPTTTGP